MIGKRNEYELMAKCERELWWYRNLHKLTTEKIAQFSNGAQARILDAGCGTGGMLTYLKKNGYFNISGFDFSPDAIEYSKNAALDVQLLDILKSDMILEKAAYDIIISHDVLCLLKEHADQLALDKLISLLKPGGLLLMNLPAGKAFRGTHDFVLSVLRRYSRTSIKKLVGDCAEIKEFIYWPFLLSPLIFGVRSFQRVRLMIDKKRTYSSDVKLPNASLNNLFYRITRWENKHLRTKFWGSSLFVVLQKPL